MTRWRDAWLSAVVGLVLCALSLWPGLVYWHDQAVFQAHSTPARAVIDRIYTSGPFPVVGGNSGRYFDEYGLVHFPARGRTAHAGVLLVPNCSGTCFPLYRVGQVLTVYYSPQNPGFAQVNRVGPPAWSGLAATSFFAIGGLACLVAASINMVAAVQDRRLVKPRRPPPASGAVAIRRAGGGATTGSEGRRR